MIKKRLLRVVPESKKYVAANVVLQWASLIANIIMMVAVCDLLADLFYGRETVSQVEDTAIIAAVALVIRAACHYASVRLGYLSSRTVKMKLREQIYRKLLRLGTAYRENVETAEIVQISVEGVDQLETYFGGYLPQFFYAMLAPLTLFVFFCFINVPSAVVLFVCVPLIPIAIVAVQRWAKKLLAKYWGQYTSLGSSFLENLEGLTTLKIYGSDEYKNEEMNKESEKFRVVTMKVLTMQLNSITIMDFIAYGGAALGMILAVTQFDAGNIALDECLLIILLAAEFFIPMRQLGSLFHVAMNGMAASDKIFALLDLPEPDRSGNDFPAEGDIVVQGLSLSYNGERKVLQDVDMVIARNRLTSIVGESGSGKSTVASVLMERTRGYTGVAKVGDTQMCQISEDSLLRSVTYVSHQSYLFKGTVRWNLLMGDPQASDERLWEVLEQVDLSGFLKEADGLDTKVEESGRNLSGGQRQRLALARALLHDSSVYIFDESTSNIDVESEEVIMRNIHGLVGTKTVILISHRLANVVDSDVIYVLDRGRVAEHGRHDELRAMDGIYDRMWTVQNDLENYRMKEAAQ